MDIVSEKLGYGLKYEYAGDECGWAGDVPKMRLSIEKFPALGWVPEIESYEAARKEARELIDDLC